MTVDHQAGDYAYPIVADPCFAFWNSSCWSQITETIGATASSQPVQVLAAVTGIATGVAASAAGGPVVGASTALFGGKFINYAPYIFGAIAVATVLGHFAVHKWRQKKNRKK